MIGSLFRFKDLIPVALRSSLIYQYCCPRCGSAYVGMTTRYFYMRVAEHRGVSFRTGKLLTTPLHSNIRYHVENTCPGSLSIDHFSIKSSSSNPINLRILESLFIKQLNPKLNLTNSSYPLEIV